jgi:hypothetical protein
MGDGRSERQPNADCAQQEPDAGRNREYKANLIVLIKQKIRELKTKVELIRRPEESRKHHIPFNIKTLSSDLLHTYYYYYYYGSTALCWALANFSLT